MKKQLLVAGILGCVVFNAYAACEITVQNNMSNPKKASEKYYMKDVRIIDGTCIGAEGCGGNLAYGKAIHFKNNGTNWSTVLDTSVDLNTSRHISNIRVEMENATQSNCNVKIGDGAWCSTDASTGQQDCEPKLTKIGANEYSLTIEKK
ncbi:hypothetical protein BH10PSE19_BH10PSE19_04720 [soil metagenome]